MATTPLDDLLSVDTLTGLIKTFADQSDNRSCSALFSRHARPLLPLGDSVSWEEVSYSRHMAPVSGPDSPHTRAKRLGKRKRSSAMAWVKAYKDLPASHLFLEPAPGGDTSDAEAVLAVELEDLANLIANTREFLACGALLGSIDVNPQSVPGSDLSFQVRFGNLTANAQALWSDPATNIRSEELKRLKQLYKDGSGLRLELAITEPDVEGYLVQNLEVKEFAKEPFSAAILQQLPLTGESAAWNRLAGIHWRFTDGTYKPEGGAVTRYFPQGKVLALPGEARLAQVLGWAEGKVHVPAGPVYGDAAGALRSLRELRGAYAYAEIRTDPVGVRIYAGWHGLPVVLNPSAVLVYDVARAAPPPASP